MKLSNIIMPLVTALALPKLARTQQLHNGVDFCNLAKDLCYEYKALEASNPCAGNIHKIVSDSKRTIQLTPECVDLLDLEARFQEAQEACKNPSCETTYKTNGENIEIISSNCDRASVLTNEYTGEVLFVTNAENTGHVSSNDRVDKRDGSNLQKGEELGDGWQKRVLTIGRTEPTEHFFKIGR